MGDCFYEERVLFFACFFFCTCGGAFKMLPCPLIVEKKVLKVGATLVGFVVGWFCTCSVL
jgi:hypothetical protein